MKAVRKGEPGTLLKPRGAKTGQENVSIMCSPGRDHGGGKCIVLNAPEILSVDFE